ncbi:MAG: cytochrome c3 family protein [Thermodesulfovibrionia bacterium]|nr:cytochrome c3 family protein [Thermodesulfovibrionia bacterium]
MKLPYTLHPTPYALCPLLRYTLYAVFFFCTLHAIDYTLNTAYAGVENTKHNLSTSGPGPIKATIEEQVCIFCHTPHASITIPLWNHTLSQASYILPSKTIHEWAAMLSIPQNPPDGDSRLCLSCHDGTVAIGSIVNLGGAATTISMQDMGTGYLTPEGMMSERAGGYIGTDLSGHHPVSIEVNDTLINDKNTQCNNNEVSFRICYPQKPVVLRPTDNRYSAGTSTGVGVQCSSCHDAHDNTYGDFLRMPEDDLCTKCHVLCSSGCQ